MGNQVKKESAKDYYSDQYLQYVMSSIPYAIVWKDKNLIFRGCNDNFVHFFGFKDRSELVGKDSSVLQSDPALLQSSREMELRVMNSGVAELFVPVKLPIKGVVHELLSSRFPMKDSQGKVIGFMAVFRDVTEENRAVRELKEAKALADQKLAELRDLHEQLRQNQSSLIQTTKMASLGVLASGLAHEINNPLTIIKGKTEEMLLMTELGTATPEILLDRSVAINSTVDRISKIISGLRTFARDSSGDQMEPTGMRAVIHETLSFCSAKFRDAKIKLKVTVADDLPVVMSRPVQISQVLLNLLNNAYDAISEAEEKWVSVEARCFEDGIEISVTDSGSGIPEKIANRIMEPFYTTKEVGKGTGLGLSISKGILESHEGKLYLDRQCVNTRFAIWIPD